MRPPKVAETDGAPMLEGKAPTKWNPHMVEETQRISKERSSFDPNTISFDSKDPMVATDLSKKKISAVQQQIEELKRIMSVNIEKAFERGEALNQVDEETANVAEEANRFRTVATAVKTKLALKSKFLSILTVFVVITIVLFIFGFTSYAFLSLIITLVFYFAASAFLFKSEKDNALKSEVKMPSKFAIFKMLF